MAMSSINVKANTSITIFFLFAFILFYRFNLHYGTMHPFRVRFGN